MPLLAGMALSFTAVATLTMLAGDWAVRANQFGRFAALVLIAAFGITLLAPGLSARLLQPVVGAGEKLSQAAEGRSSLLLGVATGLLWAPCAGPILGLVLTGAALNGASVETSLLLLAYAAGAVSSLALALLAGGRLLRTLKQALGFGEWLRRGLGAAMLAGVAAIATGLDTGALKQLSLGGSTADLEQRLLDRLPMASAAAAETARLPVEPVLPTLDGAVDWINSPPLTLQALRGKVVLVDFWTYSCINCLRTLPYLRAWQQKYADQGLVIVGVHAPEFAFEKNRGNVRKAAKDLQLDYPIAVDNDFAIWRAFHNQYWPALYFVDAQGRVRHHQFGEGNYEQAEQVIRQLLQEAGAAPAAGLAHVAPAGIGAEPDLNNVRTPETYLGYQKGDGGRGIVPDRRQRYQPGTPRLNEWALAGDWTVRPEYAELSGDNGAVVLRFHARDLHLVLGPTADRRPLPFRITIDGQPPGADHGVDVDADGRGEISGERLYQLVRQRGPVKDRTFEIRFLAPGARAFAFTFG